MSKKFGQSGNIGNDMRKLLAKNLEADSTKFYKKEN